ncbi:MAG: LCP family protein [Lachnospiraceae bacterium]|nr:LCP family protein [Lachnospiraceae bacterium]
MRIFKKRAAAIAITVAGVITFSAILPGLSFMNSQGAAWNIVYAEEESEETLDLIDDYFDINYVTINDEDYTYSDKIKTYLFMGTDHSGNEDPEEDEEYQGSMADFLLVLVVNSTQKTYGMIQLNRDTMTEVTLLTDDGYDSGTALEQICTAHWYGGSKEDSCENTVDVVSELLGEVDIDGYYALPMDYISSFNSAVGGVTITISGDLTDIDPAMTDGATITLTDEQATAFIQNRMNVGEGKNADRMDRQRQFLSAFTQQAKELMSEDSSFFTDTLDDLSEYATTDLSQNTLSKIINKLYKYESLGIFYLDGETVIGQTLGDGVDHEEYYLTDTAVLDVMTELYNLTYEDDLLSLFDEEDEYDDEFETEDDFDWYEDSDDDEDESETEDF